MKIAIVNTGSVGLVSGTEMAGKYFAPSALALKPNTDDMRETSSRTLLMDLYAAGATVTAYELTATSAARFSFGDEPSVRYAVKSHGYPVRRPRDPEHHGQSHPVRSKICG